LTSIDIIINLYCHNKRENEDEMHFAQTYFTIKIITNKLGGLNDIIIDNNMNDHNHINSSINTQSSNKSSPTTPPTSPRLSTTTTTVPTTTQQQHNESKKLPKKRGVPDISNRVDDEAFNQKLLILCHFCERDGPSVLFCTQNIHHSIRQQENQAEEEHIDTILNEHQNETLLYNIKHATLDRNQLFISSHRIKHPHTSKFKGLSLRSLSVEYVGPGREGPVLFGDETTGYSLAYVFKLKDSKARGFTRWYSYVLMDKSLSSLTLSWSFVQKYVY
jgi:hypothetical protein